MYIFLVIELACGESESASNIEVLNKMVLGTENGRNINWFKNPDPLMVSISRSNLFGAESNGVWPTRKIIAI